MPDVDQPQISIIFTIRMWQEANPTGPREWRGAVKNLLSGEVRYFREWAALVTLLPRMLEESLLDDVGLSSPVSDTDIEEVDPAGELGDTGEIERALGSKEEVERTDSEQLKGGDDAPVSPKNLEAGSS